MAFLGRVPGQLALRPVLKQTITPDGSASFTLDSEVSQNALDVFVNNVRQEPGVAYTVSGTTITFTEAPAVGSSVYIVYQKSVLGAEVLPGPDTLTTAMIKDGAITAAKLATSVDTHDSAAVQAQLDSAMPSAIDARIDSDTFVKLAGTQTITGAKTFTGTTSTPALTLSTTDNTSSAAPILDFVRNTDQANNSDYLGQLKFKGEDSSGGSEVYAKITGKIADPTNGTEDGLLEYAVVSGGSNHILARMTGNGGGKFILENSTNLEVTGDGQVDGSFGVGTASPTTPLDVEGAWVPNHGILSINATSGQYSGLTTQKDGTSYGYLYYDSDNSALNVYGAGSTALRFWTNNGERAMIDTSGTLGIATTPNSMHASYDGIQVQNSLWFTNNTNFSGFTQNAYYDGSYRYTTSREASLFRQINGRFDFLSAASGTADSAISFNTLMQVQAAGKVAINGTTADTTLHVHGSITGGSASSTGGTEVLLARYSDASDDQPNIIGTSRSSAAWYICYGLRPSTATADTFTSSVDNSTWYRGAFRVGGDYAAFRSNGGSAVNTAVGTTIATSEYVRMDHMGISFNGDTATANHLNDYEEGTCTISFGNGGTQGTFSSISNTTAHYTKVGNLVTVSYYSGSFTVNTSGSGGAIVNGLPFTSSNGSYQYPVVSVTHATCFGDIENGYVQRNGTYWWPINEGSTSAPNWTVGSGLYLMFTVTYFTDQ